MLDADSIVIAAGSEPENGLMSEIGDMGKEILLVGDSKEPRNALDALKEGFFAGFEI